MDLRRALNTHMVFPNCDYNERMRRSSVRRGAGLLNCATTKSRKILSHIHHRQLTRQAGSPRARRAPQT